MTEEKIKIRETRKAFWLEYIIAFIFIIILLIILITNMSMHIMGYILIITAIIITLIIPEIIVAWSNCIITPDYITFNTGIFERERASYHMSTITDVKYRQTPWQRTLDYGEVVIRTYSPAGTIRIGYISNPQKVASKIEEFLSKYLDKKHQK